jgi:DNA invertase Pin-like site-specific DNA recombinase
MLVGYSRVSTQDQNLNLQNDALTKAGCEKIFEDKVSGARIERKGLTEALEYVRSGDVLVVWKLDRLGRGLRDLIDKMQDLEKRGVGFKSLTENIDTTTAGGKLIFHIFGSLAEFERNLIRERTMAGLSSARARGITGGRKNKLTTEQIELMKKMYKDKTIPIKQILDTFKISKSSLYKWVK